MENSFEQRLSKTEVKLDHMQKQVDKIDSLQEAVIMLTVIQKNQEERDKKFESFYEAQLKINTEVYSMLKTMNDSYDKIKVDVGILKDNATWNWQSFLKTQLIPMLITGGVMYYIGRFV